jgi:hypothetical protein
MKHGRLRPCAALCCRVTAAGAIAAGMIACNVTGAQTMPSPPAATPATPPAPAAIQALLPKLLDDAAVRMGVAAAQLRVASVESVTWPDASLGCPQPDRQYAQVLMPGHRVKIAGPGGNVLTYHTSSRSGGWAWCPPQRATEPLPKDLSDPT